MRKILEALRELEQTTNDVYFIEMFSDGSGTLYIWHLAENKYVLAFSNEKDFLAQVNEMLMGL